MCLKRPKARHGWFRAWTNPRRLRRLSACPGWFKDPWTSPRRLRRPKARPGCFSRPWMSRTSLWCFRAPKLCPCPCPWTVPGPFTAGRTWGLGTPPPPPVEVTTPPDEPPPVGPVPPPVGPVPPEVSDPPPPFDEPPLPAGGGGPPAPGVTVGRTGPVVGGGLGWWCAGGVGRGGTVWIAIGPGGASPPSVHCAPTGTIRNRAAPTETPPAVFPTRAPGER